jgi:hypothetical protein
VFLTAVMQQRVNIKSCVKLGETQAETYEMLQTLYDDEALSRSSVFQLLKRFKGGRKIFRMIQESGVLQPLEMQT